jgi:DNA polymerase-3 subunit epsilon
LDFIAIDFETATAKFNSACSLGMIFVRENKIVDERYFLIQPPGMFMDHSNTKIHGLTADVLRDAPTFDKVWSEIQQYFHDEHLITAHNAQFDMNVLRNTLSEYNIDHPEFNYFCSIPFSSRACRGEGVTNSLKNRAEHFGIDLGEHHNALSDARTCANIILKCIELKKRKSVHSYITMHGQAIPVRPFSELNGQESMIIKGKYKNAKIKISEIAATTTEFDVQHPLFGKSIVFTGELEFMDRKDAMQKAIDLGALVKSGVSSKTDYLLVGRQDISLVGEDGLSSKEEKAYALNEKGHTIQIIKEDIFIELIKN